MGHTPVLHEHLALELERWHVGLSCHLGDRWAVPAETRFWSEDHRHPDGASAPIHQLEREDGSRDREFRSLRDGCAGAVDP